jgi:hypothetical protein
MMSERLEELLERVTVLSDTAFGDGHIQIEVQDEEHTSPLVILYDSVWVSPPEGEATKYAWGTVESDPGSYTRAPETDYSELGAADKMDEAVKEALSLVLSTMLADFLGREADDRLADEQEGAWNAQEAGFPVGG